MDNFLKLFNAKIPYTQFGKEFFLVPEHIKEFAKYCSEEPYSMGLFLGRLKGKDFEPSPALLEIIAKQTDKKIVVNEKSAWLFACGRDVLKEGIIKATNDETVIVINKENEVLGLAQKKGNYYKNLVDIGSYLRREQ